MITRVAALTCCLSLVQGSIVGADDIMTERSTSLTLAVVNAAPQAGPIRRASLSKDTQTVRGGETRWAARPIPDSGRDRSWMERHPVWTGALVGFGAGVLLTYAVTHDNGDELLTVISPAAAALFWGGVSAGVGALAGWGIGRNRDADDRDDGGSASRR